MEKSLHVPKTIKLFINGEFPRTESGRSFAVPVRGSKKIYANLCLASRKDLRASVTAALEAFPGWEKRSAYNRAQILYRMAEMLEGKRQEISEVLAQTVGLGKKACEAEIDAAIEGTIYYSGFADKFQQLIGTVNPVSGPHHCFTSAEPVGVAGLIADEKISFSRFWTSVVAMLCSGNPVIALLPNRLAALTNTLGEVAATSDVPKGVINLLCGRREELLPHFGSHMEIHAISYQSEDDKGLTELRTLGAQNMKRVTGFVEHEKSAYHLLQFVEYKTVWHPIGG